jgi:hypothetical protein
VESAKDGMSEIRERTEEAGGESTLLRLQRRPPASYDRPRLRAEGGGPGWKTARPGALSRLQGARCALLITASPRASIETPAAS